MKRIRIAKILLFPVCVLFGVLVWSMRREVDRAINTVFEAEKDKDGER